MRWLNVLLVILCLKFSLSYWLILSPMDRQNIVSSTACEFAKKAGGKAKAYTIINPENWSVEIHAEFVEVKS